MSSLVDTASPALPGRGVRLFSRDDQLGAPVFELALRCRVGVLGIGPATAFGAQSRGGNALGRQRSDDGLGTVGTQIGVRTRSPARIGIADDLGARMRIGVQYLHQRIDIGAVVGTDRG